MEVNTAGFLPPSIADSIPFSSDKFTHILTYFSLKPESPESQILKEVIEICEMPALEGELKHCSTSFEDLVHYVVSLLGKHIQVLTPHLETKTSNPNFTVGDGIHLVAKSDVVCHKLNYAYAVYLCHSISMERTHIYTVPLIGEDGSRGTSLAACHQDTSSWNPKHLAFDVLKVEPGTVPICHFLKKDTIVWVPSPTS
ncbi:RESPONSIVE TO DESICCATION 22 [Hibiscus trionum]|uniref:RESPONSIVE TO DESICCATION 22 n=1 Tax=Hibiscus trionum TaxID=183268 RepID=A0A9W7I965_HIBTR|nr:RESPONSIVE TO DESICCATION 22 [Hibiscus trionum]